MAEFAYIGDREGTEVFGLRFPRGVPVEVSDPGAVAKLNGNPDFSLVVGGVEVLPAIAPKRRGRPPKDR